MAVFEGIDDQEALQQPRCRNWCLSSTRRFLYELVILVTAWRGVNVLLKLVPPVVQFPLELTL